MFNELVKDIELTALTQEELRRKVFAQIEKDFALTGIPLELDSVDPEENVVKIQEAIEQLANDEPQTLANLFYRVDIAEKDWFKALEEDVVNTTKKALCRLLLKRELQKVVERIQFDSI